MNSYRAIVWALWTTCTPNLAKSHDIALAVSKIMQNYDRYKIVEQQTGVPAYVVACIHYRESGFDFSKHLANGDPLYDDKGNPIATTHVPQNLGPFKSWEDGAIASFKQNGLENNKNWDLVSALIALENFNGAGYHLYHNINSPYLWSYSNQYVSGKYGSDGKFDPNLVDEQIGCAVLFKGLKANGLDLKEIEPNEDVFAFR